MGGKKRVQTQDATCPLYFSLYINILIEGTNNRKCMNHTKGKCNINMCSSFCDPVNSFSATFRCGCRHLLGIAELVVVVVELSLLQILTHNRPQYFIYSEQILPPHPLSG